MIVCSACLPVWLRHPTTSVAEAETSACLEQCLRTKDCIGVDVIRDDDDDNDDDAMSLCRYHLSHHALTMLREHVTRYQLLDRCYTGTF